MTDNLVHRIKAHRSAPEVYDAPGSVQMEARILADADRIEELEAEVARLREALEVFADDRNWFDATEDNIRYPAWRGPVDEPEEFARAALAEQEKDDE